MYEVLADVVTGAKVVGFDIHKRGAERRRMTQNDGGHLASQQLLIYPGFAANPIDRRDKQAIDAPGKEPANASLLALGKIQGVRQDDIIAQVVGALLNGEDNPRENW